jgi:glycerophosphoryl diester phosphodiesterase
MAPRYVVHRGGAALWPENSLLAFRSALALNARLLELDVHLTADGEVAVIHDATLDRTTDGSGPVAARSAAALRRLRLRGPDGALTDEWVPTLGEVLTLAAPTGVMLLVEIKTPGPAVSYERHGARVKARPGPRYPGLEKKVVEALSAVGMARRALLMAFNPAVLDEIRSLAAEQPTALLVDRHHLESAAVPAVETVALASGAGASFLGLHYTLCDGEVVAAARAAGVALGVFTVNDEATMRGLAAMGVDVIISDRADLVARLEEGPR